MNTRNIHFRFIKRITGFEYTSGIQSISEHAFRYRLSSVILLCTFVFLTGELFGKQTWLQFKSGKTAAGLQKISSPAAALLSSNNNGVSFRLHLEGMYVNEKISGMEKYKKLSMPGGELMNTNGQPQLPVISKIIAVPECDGISVAITPSNEEIFYNYNIVPAPAYMYKALTPGNEAQDEIISEDKSVYFSNEYFPGKYGEVVETGYVRNQKIARIAIYPVQFNPVAKTIKTFSDFTVSLTFINPKSEINKETGIFGKMLKASALNYKLNATALESGAVNNSEKSIAGLSKIKAGSVTRVSNTEELIGSNALPVDYLVITHSSLFNSSSLTKLAEYRKNHNGFDVAIVEVDNTIYDSYPGRPHYQSMRDFISDVYTKGKASHTGDGHLGYIVLAGDAFTSPPEQNEMVPASAPSYYSDFEKGGDYYYACTGGDKDDFQDLIYGRISVGNEEELSNVVNKTIEYESAPKANWQNNLSFMSFSPWFFSDDETCDDYFYQMAGVAPKSSYISYAWRGFSADTTNAWGRTFFENHPDGQASTLNVPENISEIFYQKYTGWKWYNFITGLNIYQVVEGGQYTDSSNNCGAADMDSWLYNKLNAGQRFFVYEGHSGHGSLGANEGAGRRIFRGDQIESKLHNYGMYPFIIANGCQTGEFDTKSADDMGSIDCIAEKTVKMKNSGAIGFLGSVRESTPSAFNCVDKYVLDAFYNDSAHIMGEAVMESKLLLNSTFRRQYNLYGDPATNLWNDNTSAAIDDNNSSSAIANYKLGNNYPNPFNPSTTINFQLKAGGYVTLKVFDALGREVKILVNSYKDKGSYNLQFNGSGFASGTYYYQLRVSSSADGAGAGSIFISTKKMMLLK